MENEELEYLASEAKGSAEVKFSAGEEAKDVNGKEVNSSDFSFVQQDKSINDVKFTTKPTTFMKDAMKRFTKNQSSVVGGIILGFLFICALILPMAMTGVDISERHNYETHLPMKLFPAGTGWWDGTTKSVGEVFPYDVDGETGEPIYYDENNNIIADPDNYTGEKHLNFNQYATYPDEDVIVKYENYKAEYLPYADASGSYGFATITQNVNTEGQYGFMYNYRYQYDFSNQYTVSYQLGTLENSDTFAIPEYAILMVATSSASATPGTNDYFLLNGNFSSDYGTALEKNENAAITPHEEVSFSLNDAIDNAIKVSDGTTVTATEAAVLKSRYISLGIIFKGQEQKTSMYLKSFRVTGTTASGGKLLSAARKALNARSFGDAGGFTEAMTVEDGNALVLQEKQVDGADNPSYWTRMTYDRFESNDTFIARADITYDMYLVTYGLRNGMTLSQDKFWDWYKKGYVSWGSGYNWELSGDEDKAEALRALEDLYRNPSTFVIEESGKNSNEVSVTEITNIAKDTNNNQVVYTFTCQVMMYKYLGYNDIPIHIFGTEYQGKDLLKYVFSGLRTSLILGLIVSAINILIGVIWGSISGYYGGAVDITMERITDILGGIPYIVLMTILTIKLGANFFVFALSLCLTGWIGTSATTRSQFYRYRGREYVLASKTLGAKTPTLIFRHILPNAVGTIVTRSVLMIPSTIFSEATISYLGLGLTNLDSLGVILSKNQAFLSTYPNELVFPAIIISLLMICFNLFGNGLRDAFNPSLKGTE